MQHRGFSQRRESVARLIQLAGLFGRHCTVPDPIDNFESLEKFAHRDIPSRDHAELTQERETLTFWLAMHPIHDEWFNERVRHLDRALKHAA